MSAGATLMAVLNFVLIMLDPICVAVEVDTD